MNKSLEEIYNRDITWIKECDVVVAEVLVLSLKKNQIKEGDKVYG